MKKATYDAPIAEIVKFNTIDIITFSQAASDFGNFDNKILFWDEIE